MWAPRSPTFLQVLGRVAKQDDPAPVAVRGLVQHGDLEAVQLRDGLLEHLAQVLDGELEVLLVVLEDLGQVVARQVEGEGVGPLEGLTALLQTDASSLQELHLDPRQVRRRLQARHLLLRLVVVVLFQLRRVLVVGVAIVVVQVTLQGLAGPGLRVARLVAGLFLEAVAIVPVIAVFRPESHAHPTKLMLALTACHVVAATILLDCRIAFRTLLGIGRDPVGGFGVVLTLLDPLLDQGAWRRLVIFESATEAKAVFASTFDSWNDAIEILFLDCTFNCVLTIRRRAPLEVLLVIHVSSRQ